MDKNLVTLRLFLEPCMTFSCLTLKTKVWKLLTMSHPICKVYYIHLCHYYTWNTTRINPGSTYILTNYHFWFLPMILICFLLVPTPSKSHEWGIEIIFYNKRLLVFKCCTTGKLSSINLTKTNYIVILINKIKLNLREREMKYLGIYTDQNLPWRPQTPYHVHLCTYFKGRVFRFLHLSVF